MAGVGFRWLDILEKEFDKAFVDLDMTIGKFMPTLITCNRHIIFNPIRLIILRTIVFGTYELICYQDLIYLISYFHRLYCIHIRNIEIST